eukprot:m.69321 g.69321  ORF g.69321 m.69321 type:complete len:781 (+) comp13975_c0_seq1:1051-3393(+)
MWLSQRRGLQLRVGLPRSRTPFRRCTPLRASCVEHFSQLRLERWAFARVTAEEKQHAELRSSYPLQALGGGDAHFAEMDACPSTHGRDQPEKCLQEWQTLSDSQQRPMSPGLRALCQAQGSRRHSCTELAAGLSALSTDPFWCRETLASPSDCLLPPERFGLPALSASPMEPNAAGHPGHPAQRSLSEGSGNLHHDAHMTVPGNAFENGAFGDWFLLTRPTQPKGLVTRQVRGNGWREQHYRRLTTGHWALCEADAPLQHVVAMEYSCVKLLAQNALLIPLCATGMDMPLSQAVHDVGSENKTLALPGIVIDICRGLSELHRCNIVHGRLSLPTSVVVSQPQRGSYCARLTDWCVPLDDGFLSSQDLQRVAVAPELRDNTRQDPTQESDLFSLGVLAYFVLSEGQQPKLEHPNDPPSPTCPDTGLFPDLKQLDGHFPGISELLSVWTNPAPEEREPVERSLDNRFLLQLRQDRFAQLLETMCSLSELQQVVERGVKTLEATDKVGKGQKISEDSNISEAGKRLDTEHADKLAQGQKANRFLTKQGQAAPSDPAKQGLTHLLPPFSDDRGWKSALDEGLMQALDGNLQQATNQQQYDGQSAVQLLRCFRNLRHHAEQFIDVDPMQDLGLFKKETDELSLEGVFKYFYSLFPRCAYGSYQLMRHATEVPGFEPGTLQDPGFAIVQWKQWFVNTLGPMLIRVSSKVWSIEDDGAHFVVVVPEGETGRVSVEFFSAFEPRQQTLNLAMKDGSGGPVLEPGKSTKERHTVSFELPKQGQKNSFVQ